MGFIILIRLEQRQSGLNTWIRAGSIERAGNDYGVASALRLAKLAGFHQLLGLSTAQPRVELLWLDYAASRR
jgi:hypothetical protein